MIYNLWRNYYSPDAPSPPATKEQSRIFNYEYIVINNSWAISREYEQELILALKLKTDSPSGIIRQIFMELCFILSDNFYLATEEQLENMYYFQEMKIEKYPRYLFSEKYRKIGVIGNIQIPDNVTYIDSVQSKDSSIEDVFAERCDVYIINNPSFEECIPYITDYHKIIRKGELANAKNWFL